MNRLLFPLGVAALLSAAQAASPSYTFSYQTTHYVCQGGQRLDVSFVSTWPKGGPAVNGTAQVPLFALLNYQGQTYGLALAVSGSGARYASLYGPTAGGSGLEWWEHQGEGTLSRLTGKDAWATVPILKACRVR